MKLKIQAFKLLVLTDKQKSTYEQACEKHLRRIKRRWLAAVITNNSRTKEHLFERIKGFERYSKRVPDCDCIYPTSKARYGTGRGYHGAANDVYRIARRACAWTNPEKPAGK
jgi:hypothetical protein